MSALKARNRDIKKFSSLGKGQFQSPCRGRARGVNFSTCPFLKSSLLPVLSDFMSCGKFGYFLFKIVTKTLVWLVGNFGFFLKLAKKQSKMGSKPILNMFRPCFKTNLATFWSTFLATLNYYPRPKVWLSHWIYNSWNTNTKGIESKDWENLGKILYQLVVSFFTTCITFLLYLDDGRYACI